MASRELEHIRNAILDRRYALTEHAYDEMEEDNLQELDIESSILDCETDKVLTMDPGGTSSLCMVKATDQATSVGVVVRFVEHDQLLIITDFGKLWLA